MFQVDERLAETIVLDVSDVVDISECCVLRDAVAVAHCSRSDLVLVLGSHPKLTQSTLRVLLQIGRLLGNNLWIVASAESQASRLITPAALSKFQVVLRLDDISSIRLTRYIDVDDVPTAEASRLSSGWNVNRLVSAHKI